MMFARSVTVFFGVIVFVTAGCAPSLSPQIQASLDRAGHELDRQLTPAGQLAATASLIQARDGAFPMTQFGLLGSAEAAHTGALELNLSSLELQRTADGLRIDYVLLPTAADPTDRMGTITLRQSNEAEQFEADVRLTRREDPDHRGRPLPLAQQDQIAVQRLSGRMCIDLATVRQQAEVGHAGDLPLDARPYTITFTPSPPTAEGMPRELREGYTVTIGA